MNIEIGFWIVPTFITFISIAWLVFKEPERGNFPGIGAMLDFMVILIINLVSWLIYNIFI